MTVLNRILPAIAALAVSSGSSVGSAESIPARNKGRENALAIPERASRPTGVRSQAKRRKLDRRRGSRRLRLSRGGGWR